MTQDNISKAASIAAGGQVSERVDPSGRIFLFEYVDCVTRFTTWLNKAKITHEQRTPRCVIIPDYSAFNYANMVDGHLKVKGVTVEVTIGDCSGSGCSTHEVLKDLATKLGLQSITTA